MAKEGEPLSAQEIRIIQAVFRYGTLTGAARVVSVTYDAANGCIDRAREKLGVDDLPQLTVLAERQGLLQGIQPQPRRWKM